MNVKLSDISDSDKLSSIVITLPQAEAEASEYTTLVGFAVTGRMGIPFKSAILFRQNFNSSMASSHRWTMELQF